MHDVVIENLMSRTFAIIFEHQKYCVKTGRCLCNPNGTPSSKMILPGKSETVSGHVLSLDQVIEAKRKKQIATNKVRVGAAASADADASANAGESPVSQSVVTAAQEKTSGKSVGRQRKRRGAQK